MNPRELLAGVDVFEAGGAAAVAVAGRLLAQHGATVTKLKPNDDWRPQTWARELDAGKTIIEDVGAADPARARLVILGDPDASFPQLEQLVPRPQQTIARIEPAPDDLLLQAAAAICAGIGEPGRAPLKLPLDQSAQQGGLTLAIAACASLFSDAPQTISLSIIDVWLAFYMGPEIASARFGRSKTRRAGHRASGVPWPRTIMRCRDGFFAIQCATREHWQRFLRLVGKPELESAPLFADRVKTNDLHADEAEATFDDWFAQRTKAELLVEFLRAKLPGAPVYTIDETAAHEHLRERGAFDDDRRVNVPYRISAGSFAERPAPPPRESRQPLAGIRVVDFGWVWAGAVPGQILADLGADVIKVETATRLDYMRQGRPIVGTQRDPEQNPMFAAVNRSKRSLRIDMTQPEGAAILRDLVACSDVVIENFSPGVLDRVGLGWNDLVKVAPSLVMCSMSAAGASGPLRDIRAYATMIAGLCGLDGMLGYPGERVIGSQSSYCDPNAGLHAALAILAALHARERTGRGCLIDLSQWQAGLRAVDEALAAYRVNGTIPQPDGLRRDDRLIHGCFPTADPDEWIAISVEDEVEADVLRSALSLMHLDEEAVAGATRTQTTNVLLQRLPPEIAAPVARADRLLDDSRLREDGLFKEIEHPILGPVPVYRLPWRVDGERLDVRFRAPFLGEHNDEILRGILGLDAAQIAQLRDDN